MKINSTYINEYKAILQSTNLQRSYQEFIKFFRGLRIYLLDNLTEYKFTGNIVENNMDYSYFQFSNKELQSKGLKLVIAFVHNKFEYEIWLSGINRKIQNYYHSLLCNKGHKYTMSPEPKKYDYILKTNLFEEVNYDDCDILFHKAFENIKEFTTNINKII